jgi:hypothetical protein
VAELAADNGSDAPARWKEAELALCGADSGDLQALEDARPWRTPLIRLALEDAKHTDPSSSSGRPCGPGDARVASIRAQVATADSGELKAEGGGVAASHTWRQLS